jgi:hypothetical protein
VLPVGPDPASQELVADLIGQRDLPFPASPLAVVRLLGRWAGAAPGGGEPALIRAPRTA